MVTEAPTVFVVDPRVRDSLTWLMQSVGLAVLTGWGKSDCESL